MLLAVSQQGDRNGNRVGRAVLLLAGLAKVYGERAGVKLYASPDVLYFPATLVSCAGNLARCIRLRSGRASLNKPD